MYEVPLVDVRDLETDPQKFGRDVCSAMRDHGFLAVVGHGMTEELLRPARAATAKYLSMDPVMLEERFGRPKLARQRGVSIFMEKAVGHKVVDYKIFDMIRIDEQPEDSSDNPFGQNVWPDDLVPEYKPAVLAVMREQVKCGRQLLRGVEIGRGFPEGYLVNMTIGSETVLRSIYYPPVAGRQLPPGTMRSAPHKDINMLSVLASHRAARRRAGALSERRVVPRAAEAGRVLREHGHDAVQDPHVRQARSPEHRPFGLRADGAHGAHAGRPGAPGARAHHACLLPPRSPFGDAERGGPVRSVARRRGAADHRRLTAA